MKSKTKYFLIAFGVIGAFLLVFNSIKMQYWANIKLELNTSIVMFITGLISFTLYFLAKDWQNVLTKIMIGAFGICLVINLHLWSKYYEINQRQNRLSEYEELNTCEELENRFASDLKKGEIKYFQFGFGIDIGLQEHLKDKYKIESYGMGCIVQSEMECYNDLVKNHLKLKHNKTMSDIYKERESFFEISEEEIKNNIFENE